jgi:hypothetical protein
MSDVAPALRVLAGALGVADTIPYVLDILHAAPLSSGGEA